MNLLLFSLGRIKDLSLYVAMNLQISVVIVIYLFFTSEDLSLCMFNAQLEFSAS